MATTEEIRSDLAEIVNEVAGIPADDVQLDKSFVDDLDVDSLSMVEVVVAAEEKFDVRSPTTRSRTSRPSATPSRSSSAPRTADRAVDASSDRPARGHVVRSAAAARRRHPRGRATTMSRTRVVVTGLGTTSPVGGDVPSTWDALVAGQSGVRHLDRRLGRGAAGQDRRPRRGRADRGARAGQGPPARPLRPVRAGRGDGGLGRLRPRRRRHRRPERARRRDGLRHRRRADAARQLRRAQGEGPAPGLPARRTDADAERPGREHRPLRRRRGPPCNTPGLGLRLGQRGRSRSASTRSASAAPTSSSSAAPRPRSTRCRWPRSAR